MVEAVSGSGVYALVPDAEERIALDQRLRRIADELTRKTRQQAARGNVNAIRTLGRIKNWKS